MRFATYRGSSAAKMAAALGSKMYPTDSVLPAGGSMGRNGSMERARDMAEMKRVLRPGGTAVIFETLGTGSEEPNPPTETLAAYYAYLENEQGFSTTWIRTDYQFESVSEAGELAGFFFGDDLAAQVTANEWVILPECTGIWWLTV